MAKIKFQGKTLNDRDFPFFKIVYLNNGFYVEMNKFERITARLLTRGFKEVAKHRRRLIKELLRKDRKDARRQENTRRAGEGTGGETDEVGKLIDEFVGEHDKVHDGT